MLQFLQGWLWLFAAVAALPILLHLLSRQRLKKVRFSSLMLLTRLEKSHMRRLRLRQLLLLILRTLAILTLVFAFTRPLIRDRDAMLLSTQTAVVLVLDRSASMSAMGGAGRRIDRARSLSRSVVETLGPGDRLATIADTGGTALPDFEYSAADWHAQIDAINVGDGRANLGAALTQAVGILDTVTSGAREIYVITDGQLSSWATVPDELAQDIRLYVAAVADELQPNRSLRSLDFGGSLVIAHAPLGVTVTVANQGPEIRDLPVSLFLDGNRVAQTSATIPRDDSETVSLQVEDLEPGWHYGRMEISADAWPADNVLYFAVEARLGLPVLVVGNDRDVVVPVQAALRPTADARTPFQPEGMARAAFATDIDPRFGLVVLAGVESIPRAGWQRLLAFVERGGGLWILPGANVDRENISRHLIEPLWHARMVGRTDSLPSTGFVTLDRPAPHALFGFLQDITRFPEIRFTGTARLTPVESQFVRQRFSDGSPALLEAQYGRGRVLMLAGFAHPDQSDLFYHPIFVPLAQSAATYVARRGALTTEPYVTVGERPAGMSERDGVWQWVNSDADTSALPGGSLKLPLLEWAGIYSLIRDDVLAAYFAANIDPLELELSPVEDWDMVLGAVEFAELDTDGPIDNQITQARVGIDLWYPAVILALLFLVAEMLVAWPRRSELEADPVGRH